MTEYKWLMLVITTWGIALTVQIEVNDGLRKEKQEEIITLLESPIYQHCRVREQIK